MSSAERTKCPPGRLGACHYFHQKNGTWECCACDTHPWVMCADRQHVLHTIQTTAYPNNNP